MQYLAVNSHYDFHSAAAEPTCSISVTKVNSIMLDVTWTEPTSGPTSDGYMIYWANGDQGDRHVNSDTRLNTAVTLIVESTEQMYTITVVTLSDMLPSEPTIYSETILLLLFMSYFIMQSHVRSPEGSKRSVNTSYLVEWSD